ARCELECRVAVEHVTGPDDCFFTIGANQIEASPANRFADCFSLCQKRVETLRKTQTRLVEYLPKRPNIVLHAGKKVSIGNAADLLLKIPDDVPVAMTGLTCVREHKQRHWLQSAHRGDLTRC